MESISKSIVSSHACVIRQDSIKVAKTHNTSCRVSGSYGQVIRLDWNGTMCAGKILHTTNYEEDEEYVKAFDKEISLWKGMSHPHIVQLHGIWIDPKTELPYMVMELLSCSLSEYLKCNQGKILFKTKLRILCDVAKGLVYLHEDKNYAHRDLTTTNILLTTNLTAKIGDFGQSRLLEVKANELTKCPGNPSFMPPEAHQSSYSLSIDTFSYGCVVLHTVVENCPIPLIEKHRTELERREKWINFIENKNPLKPLICQCLENDQDKRPRATNILSTVKGIMETNNGSDVPSDTLASSHETENTATTTTATAAAAVASITSDDYNQLSQQHPTPVDDVKPFSSPKESATLTQESSSVNSGKFSSCPHERESINTEIVSRTVVYKPYWKCDECCKRQSKASELPCTVECICLQCGYQTCGTLHSKKHFKDTDHNLSLLTQQLESNDFIWCYSCNNKIRTRTDVSLLKQQLETQRKILSHQSGVVKKFSVSSHTSQASACRICQQRFGFIFNRSVRCDACLRDICRQHIYNHVCTLCRSISNIAKSDMQLNTTSVDVERKTNFIPIKGIKNLGNTSSLSVVLQIILRCREMMTTVIQQHDSRSVPTAPIGSRSLVDALDKIVKDFCNVDNLQVDPEELYKLLYEQLKGTDHNMLTLWIVLLSSLKNEQSIATNVPGGIDVITDHFAVTVKHITWCKDCSDMNVISQDEYYLLLSLPDDKEKVLDGDYEKYRAEAENCSRYPYQLSDKVFTENSLEKCLLKYIAVQQSDSENTAICQACSLRKDGTDVATLFSQQYLIERLPKTLLLHLDRVDDRHISFPLILDIAPYCCNTDGSDKKHQKLYCLNGVILQNRKSRNWHYTTYVRDRSSPLKSIQNEFASISDKYCIDAAYNGSWFYFDDCAVTPVTLKEVMNCQAYFLFYEQL